MTLVHKYVSHEPRSDYYLLKDKIYLFKPHYTSKVKLHNMVDKEATFYDPSRKMMGEVIITLPTGRGKISGSW